jgi:hypothetical protein
VSARDLAVSVRVRLLQRAKNAVQYFILVLTRYAIKAIFMSVLNALILVS